MPIVHLIEGPVGAGKSTYASDIAEKTTGVHIALDDWFVALFSADRPATNVVPWYVHRKERLLGLIWRHSQRILVSGRDVMLELGLLDQRARIEFCRRVKASGHHLMVHVLDAPHEVRLERVRRRNVEQGRTFAMVVPDHIFQMASGLWEAPGEAECSEFSVRFVAASPALER